MFPLAKTLTTIFRGRLYILMFACALAGLVLVTVIVTGMTFMAARLVNLGIDYLDPLIHWIMGGAFAVMGWFMLPALIVLIAGMFQETTIFRIEKTEYPDRTRRQAPRFWPDFIHDVRFTLWALFLNILVLPFYFLAIGPILSVLLNSYLLGREFFESAAGYHLGKSEAKILRKKHWDVVYLGGFVITVLTLTPLVNLFVPIIALAWMVHLYHGLDRTAGERHDG